MLPDDRERLVADHPQVLTGKIVDEATHHLWTLWKAENRPSLFEVVG